MSSFVPATSVSEAPNLPHRSMPTVPSEIGWSAFAALPPIADVRQHAQDQIAALPEEFKRLRNPEVYRIFLSESIGVQKEALLENPDSM